MILSYAPNPIPGLVIIVLTVACIFLSAFLYIEGNRYPKGRRTEYRARRLKIAGILLVVAVVSDIAVASMVHIDDNTMSLNYDLTLVTDGSGTLFAPISGNEKLQDELRVTSGNARISIEGTVHGTALRVEFNGAFTVEGSLETWRDLGDWELTMEGDAGNWYWVYFEQSVPSSQNTSLHISLSQTGRSGGQNDDIDVLLVDGWVQYEGRRSGFDA